MTHTKRKPRRKLIIGLTITICTIGAILYGLADRYLIQHVEAIVESKPAAASSTATLASSAGAAVSAGNSASIITSDDWSYTSDRIDISIEKVETGSGNSKITYFVADVQLKDAANLLTAFANNAFGRNIIANTSEIASANQAIFAMNGDYYGFREDGVIIRNGQLFRNEPARDGLALFRDGTMTSYYEKDISAEQLLKQGVTNTFSFGPVLVKNGEASDHFDNVKIDTNFGNRTIDAANPRTGIGVISPNHYVFVVVDGRQENSRGMTLNEFAQLFEDLGATDAYNLDGGGSSTMYFMGRVVNRPGNKGQERGVSDIIYVAE
ncbi:phosphodiester glycosidase family protein [Paenibacillus turpanensis]|uniref:phosphodiester glycosidase family protein n=1 Tax=Paenibacillus turpanensis TaxID=2689078 RepID=UPI00140CFB0C|nr:phosphodiester glycosidase family protein [Paenibacillus turpanensis]